MKLLAANRSLVSKLQSVEREFVGHTNGYSVGTCLNRPGVVPRKSYNIFLPGERSDEPAAGSVGDCPSRLSNTVEKTTAYLIRLIVDVGKRCTREGATVDESEEVVLEGIDDDGILNEVGVGDRLVGYC